MRLEEYLYLPKQLDPPQVSVRRFCLYIIVQLSCLLYSAVLKSQQGNIWYFGNFAGVSFNSAPPAILTDNQITNLEGMAVICDDNGDLLFYTDGRQVLNRFHDPMPNGTALNGHPSSYQSAVIIPKPGSTNIYYIFTADSWEGNGLKGYCYSEVDMNLDNGRGDITATKNVLLAGPSSERLTAIRAADMRSYWVVTNEWGTNVFRAYKVDCNGVNTTPVVSTIGKSMNEDTYCNIGAMRISPDGKYLVQTNVKGRAQATPTNEYAQIFDFDDVTGQLSNDRLIPLTNDGYYFGAEFSPDSRLLYIVNPFKSAVHQFDVTAGSAAAILASKQIFPVAGQNLALTGISMGPDQKLYMTAGEPALHVINQPNVQGPGCNIVLRQQPLSRSSNLALPNIVPNFYVNRPLDFTFQLLNSCNGQIQFNANVQIPSVNLVWDFGDGNTANGPNPQHTYADPNDEYLVKLTATDNLNCVHEVVSKRIRPAGEQVVANFGAVVQCQALRVQLSDSSQTGSGQATYLWDFGDGNTSTDRNPSHTYAASRVYTVTLTVSSSTGCVTDTRTMDVDFSKPVVSAGPDILVTTTQPIQLNATGATRYEWKPSLYLDNPNIGNPFMKARSDVTYVVTGYNAGGCFSTDTLRVTIGTVRVIEVPNAFRPAGKSNPVLRPILREVKSLTYFQVYNRWGQLVFSTNTIGHGWDGTIKGIPQQTGAYVWVLEVVDLDGNIIRKKGSSILIR